MKPISSYYFHISACQKIISCRNTPICSFPIPKRFLIETTTSGFSDLLTRNKNFLCQKLIKKCQYSLLEQKEKKTRIPLSVDSLPSCIFGKTVSPHFRQKFIVLASNNKYTNCINEQFDVVVKNWNFIYKVLWFETRIV